jgi:integrase
MLETPLREMQEWRKDIKAEQRIARKQRATSGTFEYDAARYLKAVTALKDRPREIAIWVAEFGQTRREKIRPSDIRAIRDRWAREPRGLTVDGTALPPLSPSTVNKRLRALSNLWTVLDGKRAPNPVREVDELPEPDPIARDLDYGTIEKILHALPDLARPMKGHRRAKRSLTKARLRILAYTGLTPIQLMRLTSAHVDLDRAFIRLPRRQKGRGVAGAVVPLLPPAVEAFRELAALDGWGQFSAHSLHKSFERACKRAGVAKARVHDLRHSLGTIAYELTGDLDVVMAMLQHASRRTVARYTMRAAAKVLADKVKPLERLFGTTSTGLGRNQADSSGPSPEQKRDVG